MEERNKKTALGDLILIEAPSHDAAENLAAEEVLGASRTTGNYLMLWTNDPVLVIGKFQNPYAELPLSACRRAGIPVRRRMSGGGTVYHDRGNLNFTVLTDRGEAFPDYERFLLPVVRMLGDLGVRAEISETSSLTAHSPARGSGKFSGSAQLNVKNRVLHHGTLLFDADLDAVRRLTSEHLASAARTEERVVSRAVKSRPAPVVNLRPLLAEAGCPMEREEFFAAVERAFAPVGRTAFTEEEKARIRTLAEEKYRSFAWNYGRTPAFSVSGGGVTIRARGGFVEAAEGLGADALVGLPVDEEEFERTSPGLFRELFG